MVRVPAWQARRTLLATHESLKGVAHPFSLYQVRTAYLFREWTTETDGA